MLCNDEFSKQNLSNYRLVNMGTRINDSLFIIYAEIENYRLENQNRSIQTIIQAIQLGLKADLTQEELSIHLFGIASIHLIGRMLKKNNYKNMEFECLANNLITTELAKKIINILLIQSNQYIIYGIRQIITTILFDFPKESSKAIETFIFTSLDQSGSNYSLLQVLKDIFHHQKHKEIKLDIFHALRRRWNNLLFLLINEDYNEDLYYTLLDIWGHILTMDETHKYILIEKYINDLMKFSSHWSANICAKFISVVNQVLSQYVQITTLVPSLEIIQLSQSFSTAIINDWLFKIPFKTKCFNFSGEPFQKLRLPEEMTVCSKYFCNIVLAALKCLHVIIKSNDKIYTEKILQVFNILDKWLTSHNKDKIYLNQIWLTRLFLNQDDQLLEMMLCFLNLYIYLQNEQSVTALQIVNPHLMFLQFIKELSFDYTLLLDFLMSNETCFLLYFVKYLKLVNIEWDIFIKTHETANCLLQKTNNQYVSEIASVGVINLHTSMNMIIELRVSIQKLIDKKLFPYNIGPLLCLLNKCEKQYRYNK